MFKNSKGESFYLNQKGEVFYFSKFRTKHSLRGVPDGFEVVEKDGGMLIRERRRENSFVGVGAKFLGLRRWKKWWKKLWLNPKERANFFAGRTGDGKILSGEKCKISPLQKRGFWSCSKS